MFDASPDGVYVWLDESHWTCNESLARMFGYSAEELENSPGFLQRLCHEEDQGQISWNYWNRVQALAFPVTFRFSNVHFEDVYFGSLSQVSSYTRANRNKEMGLTTEVRRGRWPAATIDWGTSSVRSESGIDVIPDYDSHSRHLNVDSR